MAKTFKVLSALLSYPSGVAAGDGELRTVVETEALVPAAIRRQLDALLTDIAGGDIYDLQERYVLLFDRTRSLSLHLFEHVHGESRDRGQAMVDLLAMYEDKGLAAVKNELPDYLPLFLEFLATLPQAEACDLLGQPAHILAALAERLRKRAVALRSGVARAGRAVIGQAERRGGLRAAGAARSRSAGSRGARRRLGRRGGPVRSRRRR